jgi:alpha-tubulin suppressor-like RCC1 family protein
MKTSPPLDASSNPVFVNLGTDSSGNALEAVDISAGFEHSCAVLKNGKVKCWGGNSSGQLGIGTGNTAGLAVAEMGNSLPAVELKGVAALQVSAGAGHSCATLSDGNLKCWGDNFYGQLGQGLGVATIGAEAEDLSNLSNVNLGAGQQAGSVVASQGAFTCVNLKNSSVKCFGKTVAFEDTSSPFYGVLGACWARTTYNSAAVACGSSPSTPRSGAIGYYSTDMGDALPIVALGSIGVAQLVTGNHFSCVLMADHSVKCWGANERGQLGIGNTSHIGLNPSEMGTGLAASLVTAADGVYPVSVAAGAEHACATLSNNKLKCWGSSTDNATGLKALGVTGDQTSAASATVVYDGNI